MQHQFGFHFQIFSNLLHFLINFFFFFSTLSQKLNIALEFSLIFRWFCHKCLVWVGYKLKLRGCLVCVFKQLFLVFKQHYTYILHIFSPIYIFINIFKQQFLIFKHIYGLRFKSWLWIIWWWDLFFYFSGDRMVMGFWERLDWAESEFAFSWSFFFLVREQ